MGHGSVPCSDLKQDSLVALRIKPASDDTPRQSDSKKKPPLTLFVRASASPPRFKWLFFVRHGQSKWNKASAEKNVIALVKEVDHSLSSAGRIQCMDLQEKIYRVSVALKRRIDEAKLAEADAGGAQAGEVGSIPKSSDEKVKTGTEKRNPAINAERSSAKGKQSTARESPQAAVAGGSAEGLRTVRKKVVHSRADDKKGFPRAASSILIQTPTGVSARQQQDVRGNRSKSQGRPGLAGPRRVGVGSEGPGHESGSDSESDDGDGGAWAIEPGDPQRIEALTAEFLCARRILCSPLTRALQTAIVSLTHHPVLQHSLHGKTSAGGPEEPAGRIELIATARERRNFGGFDSQGKAIGGEIIERSKREFADLYHHGVPTFVHQTLKVVDVNDCTYPWWNSNKESIESFARRMKSFCEHISHLPDEGIVVVGHSHFIREFVRNRLSPEFRKARPVFAESLGVNVVCNCGVLGMRIDCDDPSDPQILELELLLDSKMRIKKKRRLADAGHSLFKGIVSNVKGFMRRQARVREKRKETRFRDKESDLWFQLLAAARPDALAANYQYTNIREDKTAWNRSLLNIHLGQAFFKKLMSVNPAALRSWYYFESSTPAGSLGAEEKDWLLTPWDIDLLHDDLVAFGAIKGADNMHRLGKSRSRSRSRRRDDEQKRRAATTDTSGSTLDVPSVFGARKASRRTRQVIKERLQNQNPQVEIPIDVVTVLPKRTDDCEPLKVFAPLLGQYHRASPGVWRHTDNEMCIYICFSRGRKNANKCTFAFGELDSIPILESTARIDLKDAVRDIERAKFYIKEKRVPLAIYIGTEKKITRLRASTVGERSGRTKSGKKTAGRTTASPIEASHVNGTGSRAKIANILGLDNMRDVGSA